MTWGSNLKIGKVRAATLAIVATLAGLGAGVAAQTSGRNWNTQVVAADSGHRIGNPNAPVKLIEFISYTCPHCAAFSREGGGPLELAYVGAGKVNLEIRHLLRDPVDLTVAMLTHCGAAAKFPQNHNAFMLNQDKWIAPLGRSNATQQARWRQPGAAGRRAVAADFGFYPIMERRGYSRAQANQCLADEPLAKTLAEASAKDWKRPGISGTPAFAIDGTVLAGTHDWGSLQPQLAARF